MEADMRDMDVRSVLHQQLSDLHKADSNTLIINELGLCEGSVRVDVAVVNGSISGFEIKSEKDTLERLPAQLQGYNRTLDFVTLVTAENHLCGAQEIVPAWWGITVATQSSGPVRLGVVREAARNPDVDPMALAQLLWKDEVIEILKGRGLAKGLSGKPRKILWARLAECVEFAELSQLVRERLKARAGWLSALQQV